MDAVTGGASPSAAATGHQDEADALLDVSRCMRGNGYPSFPDPVRRYDGHWE